MEKVQINTKPAARQESPSAANRASQKRAAFKPALQLVDNRPEALQARELQQLANSGPQSKRATQLKVMADDYAIQQKHVNNRSGVFTNDIIEGNQTKLSDNLETVVDDQPGLFINPQVQQNSSRLARVNAHAITEGRVKPTLQMKGVNINDDNALEKEADVMGYGATKSITGSNSKEPGEVSSPNLVQMVTVDNYGGMKRKKFNFVVDTLIEALSLEEHYVRDRLKVVAKEEMDIILNWSDSKIKNLNWKKNAVEILKNPSKYNRPSKRSVPRAGNDNILLNVLVEEAEKNQPTVAEILEDPSNDNERSNESVPLAHEDIPLYAPFEGARRGQSKVVETSEDPTMVLTNNYVIKVTERSDSNIKTVSSNFEILESTFMGDCSAIVMITGNTRTMVHLPASNIFDLPDGPQSLNKLYTPRETRLALVKGTTNIHNSAYQNQGFIDRINEECTFNFDEINFLGYGMICRVEVDGIVRFYTPEIFSYKESDCLQIGKEEVANLL